MERDFRATAEFQAVAAFYGSLFKPGSRHVFTATDLATDSAARALYFTGLSFTGGLEDGPSPGVYRLDLDRDAGVVPIIAGVARLPRPSPDGTRLAYVVPGQEGDGLFLLVTDDGQPLAIPEISGHIEALQWSPDGTRLLLVVAGSGADLSGREGGFATTVARNGGPDWLPDVETGQGENLWRQLWVYDAQIGKARIVSSDHTNVWEASWCGRDRIAIVRSSDHSESSWYTASLALIDLDGREQPIYSPQDQIGLPVGSPDGCEIAFVEAFCSDRGVVCGTLKLADRSGVIRTLETNGVEVTGITWRSNTHLHFAGHRAFETVTGDYHLIEDRTRELWATERLTAGEWYPNSLPIGDDACVVVAEAYGVPPQLMRITPAGSEMLHSFGSPDAEVLGRECGEIEPVRWNAPDGLEIHGWLVRPPNVKAPYPLMVDIHGGPVWANRNRWMGRLRATALLAQRGYAVLYPNPRGSSTRGQDFCRLVAGDMGGADTQDLISACDALAERGLIDRTRVALTGTSYGGFMSAWLVTQDRRFAAAVPISPVSNWYSQHRTSQIAFFDELFLQGSASEPDGKYFHRSPAMFADRVRTPTLVMAGARDKNTPPGQAVEFFHSLLEHRQETALVIYPKDGHSLRGYPAYLDTAARILRWLQCHMPSAQAAPDQPK